MSCAQGWAARLIEMGSALQPPGMRNPEPGRNGKKGKTPDNVENRSHSAETGRSETRPSDVLVFYLLRKRIEQAHRRGKGKTRTCLMPDK